MAETHVVGVRGAVVAALRNPIVDHAVAVVVEAVAGLGAREHLTRAGAPAARAADLRTGAADAHAAGARGAVVAVLRDAVVDDAVAVVVAVVADLRDRDDLTRAGAPVARGAGLRAAVAGADPGGVRRARVAALWGEVVDHAVAVVIDEIAGLGRRRPRPGVGAHRHPRGAVQHADDADARQRARGPVGAGDAVRHGVADVRRARQPADRAARRRDARGVEAHEVDRRAGVALEADGGAVAGGAVPLALHPVVEHVDGVGALGQADLEGDVLARVGRARRVEEGVVPLGDVPTERGRPDGGRADAVAARIDVVPEPEDRVLDGGRRQRAVDPRERGQHERELSVCRDTDVAVGAAVEAERERQRLARRPVVVVRQEVPAPGDGADVDPGHRRGARAGVDVRAPAADRPDRELRGDRAGRGARRAGDPARRARPARVAGRALVAGDAHARGVADRARAADRARRLPARVHAGLHRPAAGAVEAVDDADAAGVGRDEARRAHAAADLLRRRAGELHLRRDERRRQRPVGRGSQRRLELEEGEVIRPHRRRHRRANRGPDVEARGRRRGPVGGVGQAGPRGARQPGRGLRHAHAELDVRALGDDRGEVELAPVRRVGAVAGRPLVDAGVDTRGARRGARRRGPADRPARRGDASGLVAHEVDGRPGPQLDAHGGAAAGGAVPLALHLVVEDVDGVGRLAQHRLVGHVLGRVGRAGRVEELVVPLDDVLAAGRAAVDRDAGAAAAVVDVVPEREDRVADVARGEAAVDPPVRRVDERDHAVRGDARRDVGRPIEAERERQRELDGAVVGVEQDRLAAGRRARVAPGQRGGAADVVAAGGGGAGGGDAAANARAPRAEDCVRGVGDGDVGRPGRDRVTGLGADDLVAALGRAVARALGHHADEARRRRVVGAPAAALGPLPRLRAPRHRVAGALPDVAGEALAEGEAGVDVAGARLVADAAQAARPRVGEAAAVALVGDAGVAVVAVDVDTARAEAVAVTVAVFAVVRRPVGQLGDFDEVGGAVETEVVAGVHARGGVEGDGDRGVLEPDERAAAAAAHEGQQRCEQDRRRCPPDLHQTPRSSGVWVARRLVDLTAVSLMALTAEFSTFGLRTTRRGQQLAYRCSAAWGGGYNKSWGRTLQETSTDPGVSLR